MTKPHDLSRIPSAQTVVINAIDAEQMLDWSFWPQLLGEQIYDLHEQYQPPPVEPAFPLSDKFSAFPTTSDSTPTTTTPTTTTALPSTTSNR